MAIIGIDLGTTNSLASVWQDGKSVLIPNSFGEYLTPSVVGIDEDNKIIIGKIAKERLISHPDKTAASFKCFMGTAHEIKMGNKTFSPPELSSFILRQLKQDAEIFLGEEVTEAVISVPAYFDDNGRNATKLAGQLAGLKVERIINEPSAAALAYKLNDADDETFLVFDFGGGTLDISIVDIFDSIIEIISVAGDNHLGGDDFNRAIAEYFCKKNNLEFDDLSNELKAILIKQSEQCKIALSTQEKAAIVVNTPDETYSLVLDNQQLLNISAPLFKRIEAPIVRAIKDSSVSPSDISEVILIGGSSHMLLVQKYLENLFKMDISLRISPDTAVALGAGIAAGIKERKEGIKDMILTDICPFTLGCNVYNEGDVSNDLFFPMIERNSTLPASFENIFSTVGNNQRSINIKIAQGEKMYFKNNLYLGNVELKVPPAPAGWEKVKVRFTYDINGILQVEVKSDSTGESKSKLILNKNTALSDKELNRKLAELEKIKIHPRDTDDIKLLTARAERLFEENIGELRSCVENALDSFNVILASQNPRKIRRAKKQFEKYLDSVEYGSGNPFSFFYEDNDFDDEEDI